MGRIHEFPLLVDFEDARKVREEGRGPLERAHYNQRLGQLACMERSRYQTSEFPAELPAHVH